MSIGAQTSEPVTPCHARRARPHPHISDHALRGAGGLGRWEDVTEERKVCKTTFEKDCQPVSEADCMEVTELRCEVRKQEMNAMAV